MNVGQGFPLEALKRPRENEGILREVAKRPRIEEDPSSRLGTTDSDAEATVGILESR